MSLRATPSTGAPAPVRDTDGNLVDHLRSMQQMERETQETLAKFMSALSHRSETDYAALLEDKIGELQQAEAENLRLRGEMDKYEDRIEQLQTNEDRILKEKGQVHEEKLRAGKAATQADHIIKNLQAQMRAQEQKHAQALELKASLLSGLEEENVRVCVCVLLLGLSLSLSFSHIHTNHSHSSSPPQLLPQVRSKVHSDEAQARLEVRPLSLSLSHTHTHSL